MSILEEDVVVLTEKYITDKGLPYSEEIAEKAALTDAEIKEIAKLLMNQRKVPFSAELMLEVLFAHYRTVFYSSLH